ncbi:MAG: hypothetical protein Q9193_001657 [Seirophora villosa]
MTTPLLRHGRVRPNCYLKKRMRAKGQGPILPSVLAHGRSRSTTRVEAQAARTPLFSLKISVVKVAEDPETSSGKKVMIGSRKPYTLGSPQQAWEGIPTLMYPCTYTGKRSTSSMYQAISTVEFEMTDNENDAQKRPLGKAPTTHEKIVSSIGAEWRKELKFARWTVVQVDVG